MNSAGTLEPDTQFTGTYTVSANGRGQVAINTGQSTINFAIYLQSGARPSWCRSIPAHRPHSALFIGDSEIGQLQASARVARAEAPLGQFRPPLRQPGR